MEDRLSPRPLSGHQAVLTHGRYRAEIASIGASLRSLTYEGRDLIVPFAADEVRPVFRGATLVPWPNRIASGRYTFEGKTYQLPLTEPDRNNSLHGLGIWEDWSIGSSTPDSVTFCLRIPAQEGYPFDVAVQSTFTLDEDGLRWAVTATNLSTVASPFGVASHAYLTAGAGHVNEWTLSLPADRVLEVSPDRLLPVALRSVESFSHGTLDFRSPRLIEDSFIDHAFTQLRPSDDGMSHVALTAADGQGVAMAWDAGPLPWVQVHTADRPEPELNRCGLAVEPMSCPPDAFNSGTDLVVLAPGDTYQVSWRIHALGALHG